VRDPRCGSSCSIGSGGGGGRQQQQAAEEIVGSNGISNGKKTEKNQRGMWIFHTEILFNCRIFR